MTQENESEKTEPTKISFLNNCIVFKVQNCMYKNTVVLASAPPKKRENRRKAQTLGRRVRKQETQCDFTEK